MGRTRLCAIVVAFGVGTGGCAASATATGAKVQCCRGKTVSWRDADLPLTVWFDPRLPRAHIETYRLISDQINRLAGLTVFQRGEEAPPLAERVVIPHGHVLIRADIAAVSAATELDHDPKTGVIETATVTMPVRVQAFQLRHLMTHELLHVLGYGHGEATTRAEMAILRAALDLAFIRMDYGDPATAGH